MNHPLLGYPPRRFRFIDPRESERGGAFIFRAAIEGTRKISLQRLRYTLEVGQMHQSALHFAKKIHVAANRTLLFDVSTRLKAQTCGGILLNARFTAIAIYILNIQRDRSQTFMRLKRLRRDIYSCLFSILRSRSFSFFLSL